MLKGFAPCVRPTVVTGFCVAHYEKHPETPLTLAINGYENITITKLSLTINHRTLTSINYWLSFTLNAARLRVLQDCDCLGHGLLSRFGFLHGGLGEHPRGNPRWLDPDGGYWLRRIKHKDKLVMLVIAMAMVMVVVVVSVKDKLVMLLMVIGYG